MAAPNCGIIRQINPWGVYVIGLTEEQLEKIINLLAKELEPYAILLFGSGAKGALNRESDIDLGFLSPQTPGEYQLFLLAQILADELGREVHLVNLNQTSTVLQALVVATGQVIYYGNRPKYRVFAMEALKNYAKLNEERAPILNMIRERGSIYGQ